MKTDVIEQSTTRVQVNVGFETTEIASNREKLVRDFSKQVKIPGFRPGKVPLDLVVRKFGKDIEEELKQRLVRQAYNDGVVKADLDIYSVVDIKEIDLGSAEPTVEFIVDIRPKFDLPEYKGLPLTKASTDVTDEEVEQSFQQLLTQRAEFRVHDREAAKGDFVKCSYTGKIGDQLISEIAPDSPMFGTQESTWEEAGADEVFGVASLIEALVGMKTGDSKVVEHDFPEDFSVEPLQGKKASYSVSIHEVRERVLPEVNQEFLESLKVESVDQLKENIRSSIRNRKEQQIQGELRKEISEKLRSSVSFDLPESSIQRETESILEDYTRHQMRRGADQAALQEQTAQLMDDIQKTARERVKLDILIGRIIEKEDIKVEANEFSQIILQEAMAAGVPVEKYVERLKKDQDMVEDLKRRALFSKALEFVISQATVTEMTA